MTEQQKNNLITVVERAAQSDHGTLLKFTVDEAIEAEGRANDIPLISEAISAALDDPMGKALYFIARSYTMASPSSASAQPSGHVSVVKEWSDWNNTYYLWITSMYVAPFARGEGVMSALLEAVDHFAREIKAPEVRIYVHKENMRGTRAWLREGFKESPYWMGHREVK